MFTINNFNNYHTLLPLLQKITLSNSYLSFYLSYHILLLISTRGASNEDFISNN